MNVTVRKISFKIMDAMAFMSIALLTVLAVFAPDQALALNFTTFATQEGAINIAKGVLGLFIIITIFSETIPNVVQGKIPEALKSVVVVLVLAGISIKLKDLINAIGNVAG